MTHRIRAWSQTQKGFTLLEMATVTAILAALSAIVAIAVTGTAGEARSSSKDGDMKNVDTAVARYESDNSPSLPILESSEPTKAVAESGSAGMIKIVVNTGETNFSAAGTPPTGTSTGEVLCSTTATSTGSLAKALDSCLGSIDFTLLVVTYITSSPQHATDDAAESGDTEVRYDNDASTSDASFGNCTLNGDTCAFYFLDAGGVTAVSSVFTVPDAALKVWNVDTDNHIVVLKGDAEYGK